MADGRRPTGGMVVPMPRGGDKGYTVYGRIGVMVLGWDYCSNHAVK